MGDPQNADPVTIDLHGRDSAVALFGCLCTDDLGQSVGRIGGIVVPPIRLDPPALYRAPWLRRIP
jgi:hypothetical protein